MNLSRQNLADALVGIAAKAQDATTMEPWPAIAHGTFWLTDSVAEHLGRITRDLFAAGPTGSPPGQGYGARLSEKQVTNHLLDAIERFRREAPSNKRSFFVGELHALDALFDASTDPQETAIPLYGISIAGRSYEVGDVVLRQMTPHQARRWLRESQAIFQTLHNSDETKEWVTACRKKLIEDMTGKVCAFHHCAASPGRSLELALEATELALHLLRFSSRSAPGASYELAIGLLAEEPTGFLQIVQLSPSRHASSSSKRIGGLGQLVIDARGKRALKGAGMPTLNRIARTPDRQRTELERALLRAIQWYGRSRQARSNENRLFNLITALEALMTARGQRALAEAVALTTAKNARLRLWVFERLVELHDLRSSAVHGDQVQVTDENVRTLDVITVLFLRRVAARAATLATKGELADWILQTKFA